MLRISCPHCGPRVESELEWGGPAGLVRPPLDSSDEQWAEYLFMRDNVRGPVAENWWCKFGCGRWFVVERDTSTHAIRATHALAQWTGHSSESP